MSFISSGKDHLVSKGLTMAAEQLVKNYGTVEEISLDSAGNRITARILLTGERTPVTFTVHGYTVLKEGDNAWLKLGTVHASRQWMDRLITDHLERILPDCRVPIPAEAAGIIGMLV